MQSFEYVVFLQFIHGSAYGITNLKPFHILAHRDGLVTNSAKVSWD